MKKYFLLLAAFLLCAPTFVACGDDDEPAQQQQGGNQGGGDDQGGGGNQGGGGGGSQATPSTPIKVTTSGKVLTELRADELGQTEKLSFDRFPVNFEDFQRTYTKDLESSIVGNIAAHLMAEQLYYYDQTEGEKAIRLCNYSTNQSQVLDVIKYRFRKGKNGNDNMPALVAAFLDGATPLNAYHPKKPYTIIVQHHPTRGPEDITITTPSLRYWVMNVWSNGVKNEDKTYGTWRQVCVAKIQGKSGYKMYECAYLYYNPVGLDMDSDPATFEELH